MSRLDEAMRRAAREGASADTSDVQMVSTIAELGDVDALQREPFPLEAPEPVEATEHEPFPLEMPRVSERRAGVGAAPRSFIPPADERAAEEPASARGSRGKGPGEAPRATLFDRIDTRLGEKIVVDDHIMPSSREQYRRLAAVLHDAQNLRGVKVIMIGSALPGEGKTLTASNLALTFSESYRKRVLLIDADLRRPSLHGVFRVDSSTGLADDLANPGMKLVVRQISPDLSLLPAGRPSQDPMAGLTSARMQQLVDEARQAFDWVIVDTPPLGLLPDAHLLASMMDGVVIVIKASSTPHDAIKRSLDAVGRPRVLGVVLNAAMENPSGSYGYEYYGYHADDGVLERS